MGEERKQNLEELPNQPSPHQGWSQDHLWLWKSASGLATREH